KFRSIFHSPSQKLKILAIPNILDHWKSYELGFTKKRDDHNLFLVSKDNAFCIRFVQVALSTQATD
ncbi:hypothetical protein B296_00025002, partial [Ensete ventricosum]